MSRRHTLFLTCILLISIYSFLKLPPYIPSLTSPNPHLPPTNSTLGFGTILAVSRKQSPRKPSLLWAANLIDLNIVIPEQPDWTFGDIQGFRAKQGSTISNGSALAWLGHLHALQSFLTTPHETALILEDDTDFSLYIRHTQTPLLASAMRSLLTSPSSSSTSPDTKPQPHSPSTNDPDFWSPTSSWDILYPGHCDDLPSPTYLSSPHTMYKDPTTPPFNTLHPDTSHFLATLHVPSSSRILHRAYWPFCTFAYAVTRSSAALILQTWAKESEGGMEAFDVALLSSCRDKGWRCWSVSPEVFHHGVGGSEIARVDGLGGQGVGSVRATWNLECAARSRQVWVDEEDKEGRAQMKEMVGRMVERGECPVDGVEEERGWKGCEGGECGAQS